MLYCGSFKFECDQCLYAVSNVPHVVSLSITICRFWLRFVLRHSRANIMARSSVRSSFVSQQNFFLETVQRINVIYCGKVPIYHIPRPLLLLKNLNFGAFLRCYFRFQTIWDHILK